MWPPRASTISPSPTSTSLTAARPMPLAHHLEEGSLVGLPGTCSLLGGRACLFQVCSPPWWLVWLLWLSAGKWVVELMPQAGGGSGPLGFPEKHCSGRG